MTQKHRSKIYQGRKVSGNRRTCLQLVRKTATPLPEHCLWTLQNAIPKAYNVMHEPSQPEHSFAAV
jgi:hypothetical protein